MCHSITCSTKMRVCREKMYDLPESRTTPVVLPVAYKLRTACIEMNKAGTLNVSKNISAALSRFLLGLSGASAIIEIRLFTRAIHQLTRQQNWMFFGKCL